MAVETVRADGVRMERATAQDLDRIMPIEQTSFSVPWTRKMFEVELGQNPFGHVYVARPAGAEDQVGGLLGYVCFWVVFEEFRLMTLAVRARRRRVAPPLPTGRAPGAVRSA